MEEFSVCWWTRYSKQQNVCGTLGNQIDRNPERLTETFICGTADDT